MIVLHAAFASGRLRLWGEAKLDAEPATPSRRRKPRGREAPRPAPYPFDAGRERLAAALAKTPAELALPVKTMEVWTAWLPTRDGQPVASSPLVAEPPSSRGKTTLAPWTVTARPLTSAEAVDLLSLCADRHVLAAGVVVGSDLAFWAAALRFAGSLVARQHFLPGLAQDSVAQDGGAPRAEWQPVFVGRDAEELARLSRRLPPAARALGAGAERAPETAAAEVVKSFLTGTVDRLARLGAARAGERAGKRPNRSVPAFPSFHDAWLQALRDDDGAFAARPNELSDLRAQVDAWRRPIALAAVSPFRLSFRLEEPPDGESAADLWQVRYLLQPHDDRSLLVPVGELWRDRVAPAELARRLGARARESTLSALGQAASICPRIAASLETAAPDGYETDTAGAHEFLTETALALEQAGFGVLLPAWWTRKGTKLRLAARAKVRSPKMQGGAGLSLQDVVHFRWEVALGDKALTAAELEALARLKTPLVRIRGQWVELSAGEIRAAIEFWRQRGEGAEATVRDVVRMALGGETAAAGLEVDGVKASGWIKKLLDELDDPARLGEVPAPAGFAGELRPYQARGYAWLAFLRRWGLGACLADDMGLGKTVQTLVLVQRDYEEAKKKEKKPVLLVCPTSVINNWLKEAARFTPGLPVVVHHGAGRKKKAAFRKQARAHALVLTSYALLHRDAELLRDVGWAGVVLDEAQNVKNPETLQARAARSLPAEYRIALTGTPVENNVGDLWSIMEFLNPGLLGTRARFKRDFFVPIQAERDPEAARRLKRLTGPFVLRRLKTDKSIISDLPEKQEMKVFCTLTREQASLYRAVVKEVDAALEEADGMKRRGLVLATLSKLKQVCNHPAQFLGDNSSVPGRSGKLARLTEMLEEVLEVGERALVFSQFAEMGGLLVRHLEETFGREVLFLHGGVAKARRDRMVDRFQSDEGPPLLVLSLKAGGTGLNLTRASHVFHYDRWWNPAVEDQATDRAFRIGQRRRVQVHKFLCAGTVEEKIDEMIERKKSVAREVVGTGEAWLTELSNTELRGVFALRGEAVRD